MKIHFSVFSIDVSNVESLFLMQVLRIFFSCSIFYIFFSLYQICARVKLNSLSAIEIGNNVKN